VGALKFAVCHHVCCHSKLNEVGIPKTRNQVGWTAAPSPKVAPGTVVVIELETGMKLTVSVSLRKPMPARP